MYHNSSVCIKGIASKSITCSVSQFPLALSSTSLKELADFIKHTDKGLTKPVDDGDYDGLVECMEHLTAVKERQATTDEMFEPLKQTIELLKTYEQEMPEEVHMQLQVCVFCCLST